MWGRLLFQRRPSAFTVHEPPPSMATRVDRAVDMEFVKDGMSWSAAIFPPGWLIGRGQWLALAAYVAGVLALVVLFSAAGMSGAWIALIVITLNLIFGLEAPEIERWSLDRSGWREVATVTGVERDEVERRFFDAWLPGEQLPQLRDAQYARAESPPQSLAEMAFSAAYGLWRSRRR